MVRPIILLWDDRNEEHIARHGLRAWEVDEAADIAPYLTRGRGKTYRLIGPTRGGRLLTVILARRGGRFYVVTARDADDVERSAYRQR